MEEYIKKTILVGIVSWTTIFLVLRKTFPKRSFDFCNRIVSTIHAILAVTLATLSVQDWKCPICPVASKSSHQQMEVLAVSLSYLIYDMVCCLFDEKINWDNTIHHLVSIVGLMATLSYQKSGSELVGALWVSEMSSPFLHLRELLKELGYKDTPLNLTTDILFASIFTFARMMIGPYITYVTITSNNPFLIKTMALGLLLVSAFWFFKIVRMMKYKLTKNKSSTSKNGIKHNKISTSLGINHWLRI